jgi:GH15 family glucan-1,4-alpha-glucosidase
VSRELTDPDWRMMQAMAEVVLRRWHEPDNRRHRPRCRHVVFQQIVDATGPTGLLPEEYDLIAERSLGNHPQAYSHLGLIRCAMLLDAIS